MKACAKAAGETLPLVHAPTRQSLAQSFVKVSRLSSQHETKSVVSCSVRLSDNVTHRIEATAGHILPATTDNVMKAIDSINRGQVIAVPTDTIYGFACDACSAEAVNCIYEIKGRIQTRPLAICVADVPDISRFAVVDHLPHGLLDSLLPGPVTVVLKRGNNSILERSLNPGLESIGVRVPDFDFIRAISRGAGSALALTSANLSGRPSSVNVKDFEDLWPHCSYVFDGGILPSGRAGSTIVDLITPGVYKILRDGSSRQETAAVLGKFGFVEAS
ncbi:yrdC domain-containing protein, mitochondrial-like [Oryza brachyantha]|uniref:Threonylcarbamoyl-AMP synthase n=1 Tax=Oryza brachyantha TaxID=4533 RepID=J3LL36_ORYBR|nr:yrdC domain-containing protein, mitochondrial-like [Oryza brachyantha]